jgi:hypothetical protein
MTILQLTIQYCLLSIPYAARSVISTRTNSVTNYIRRRRLRDNRAVQCTNRAKAFLFLFDVNDRLLVFILSSSSSSSLPSTSSSSSSSSVNVLSRFNNVLVVLLALRVIVHRVFLTCATIYAYVLFIF